MREAVPPRGVLDGEFGMGATGVECPFLTFRTSKSYGALHVKPPRVWMFSPLARYLISSASTRFTKISLEFGGTNPVLRDRNAIGFWPDICWRS